MKLGFRPVTADGGDRRFVVATWSSSYKSAYASGLIQSEDWPRIMHEQIGKLIARPGSTTLVAFERSDPDFLYGHIAGDVSDPRIPPMIFYVYVKQPYRRSGIARALFAELGVDPLLPFVYACKTAVLTDLHAKIPRSEFDPTRARYPKEPRT